MGTLHTYLLFVLECVYVNYRRAEEPAL